MHASVPGICIGILLALSAPLAGAQQPLPGGTERAAILKAAGAEQRGGNWVLCADDPHGGGAQIEQVRDFNGDGRPDALVIGQGSFCYGAAEAGYVLLSKQPDGRWKVIENNSGIPEFLATRGKDGWPDISVGGPGFCFPVLRWNGREYAVHRHAYEGKPCTPQR